MVPSEVDPKAIGLIHSAKSKAVLSKAACALCLLSQIEFILHKVVF